MKVGILTGGGDCPGLNAVIRAVGRRIMTRDGEVVGILEGWKGLVEALYEPLGPREISGLLPRGGTILGTTRTNPLKVDGGVEQVLTNFADAGFDALVAIGGEDTLGVATRLNEQHGFPVVGVPKTIDNDLAATELTFGFMTALDTATEALDRLHTTAESHDRVMILEVMGRDAGHIALAAGIAGGADVILIPEIPYTLERVAAKIEALKKNGRNFALIVVAEAVETQDGQPLMTQHTGGQATYGGIGPYISERIAELTGAETRVTVLGHVQRGGTPEPGDRVIASAFGVQAVELIAAGRFDRMVAWQNRRVVDVPIAEAIAHYQAVDPGGTLVSTARGLDISFGD